MSLQRCQNSIGVEPLRHQAPVEPRHLSIVGQRVGGSESPCQSRFEQGVVIDVREDLVDDASGRGLVDAGALDLHPHPLAASPADRRLCAGDGFGHPGIVYRFFVAEPRDRFVYEIGRVASKKPLANLCPGELAAREQLEAVDVGRVASCQTS